MGKHSLMRMRMRKMDDLGNEIKNGGAWTSFRQHLSPYYEKSSEGTLFSSAQQIQIMDFLMNDVDVAAMGPQVYDAISRLDMHACMHACMHAYIHTYIRRRGRYGTTGLSTRRAKRESVCGCIRRCVSAFERSNAWLGCS